MKQFIPCAILCAIIAAGCGGGTPEPKEWSCQDVGKALSDRVDECLPEVHEQVSFIAESGDVFRLWNELELCDKFFADNTGGISDARMADLRECGAWLVNHECAEIGASLRKIIVEKQKDFGQPPACNTLLTILRDGFRK